MTRSEIKVVSFLSTTRGSHLFILEKITSFRTFSFSTFTLIPGTNFGFYPVVPETIFIPWKPTTTFSTTGETHVYRKVRTQITCPNVTRLILILVKRNWFERSPVCYPTYLEPDVKSGVKGRRGDMKHRNECQSKFNYLKKCQHRRTSVILNPSLISTRTFKE